MLDFRSSQLDIVYLFVLQTCISVFDKNVTKNILNLKFIFKTNNCFLVLHTCILQTNVNKNVDYTLTEAYIESVTILCFSA